MLVLDCDRRISATEALSHPYFSQYHDPEDEPEAPLYDQTPESKDRTLEEWKGQRKRDYFTFYLFLENNALSLTLCKLSLTDRFLLFSLHTLSTELVFEEVNSFKTPVNQTDTLQAEQ